MVVALLALVPTAIWSPLGMATVALVVTYASKTLAWKVLEERDGRTASE